MKITAAVITLNEEANIDACLDSVSWADELVVIDGGSTDETIQKAKRHPIILETIPFTNFSQQKNEAIKRATGDWVFLIDADERVTSKLAREIRRIAENTKPDAVYSVKRETSFFQKKLKYSGTQDDYQIRLWPKNSVHFERPVHEQVVTDLPVKQMKNLLIHYSTQNRSHYDLKLERYLPFEIEIMASKEVKVGFMHVWFRPVAKFIQLYFLKLGMLDGWTGFQFAYLSAMYEFLKLKHYKNKTFFSDSQGKVNESIA